MNDEVKYKLIESGIKVTHILLENTKRAVENACRLIMSGLRPINPWMIRVYFADFERDSMEEQFYMYGDAIVSGDDNIPFYQLPADLTYGLHTVQQQRAGETAVTVPLKHENELIGFIQITRGEPLDDDILDVLDSYGDAISIGLYTILQKKWADQQKAIFDRVMRISADLQAANSIDEIVDLFMTNVLRSFRFDRVSVFLFDSQGQIDDAYCINAGRGISRPTKLPDVPRSLKKPAPLEDLCGYWIPIKSKDSLLGCVLIDNVYTQAEIEPGCLKATIELCNLIGMNIENIRLFSNVRKMAQFDELTGVYNRRMGMESIDKLIRLSNIKGTPFVLCFIDVNDLKTVNDTHGHSTGDDMLRGLVSILKKCIRQNDIISRIGGDEFIVLFPECTIDEAEGIWDRIAEEMKSGSSLENCPLYVINASHGMAVFYPNDNITPAQLITKADERMYSEKSKKVLTKS